MSNLVCIPRKVFLDWHMQSKVSGLLLSYGDEIAKEKGEMLEKIAEKAMETAEFAERKDL